MQKKITAPIRSRYDHFGNSVDISENYVIVGSYCEDEDFNESNNIEDAGSAYIYFRNQDGTDNWGLQKKITAPIRAYHDNFGRDVAISGDYAIVGAPLEDEDEIDEYGSRNTGSVYFVERRKALQYRSNATNRFGLAKLTRQHKLEQFNYASR